MRVVKEHDERKNEILDTAEVLFAQKGYDKTSIQAILDQVKIAKGTFYYYFKSKEEVMDAILLRYNEKLLQRAWAVANQENIPAEIKLLQTISALHLNEEEGKEILMEIHKPENVKMHQKIMVMLLKEVTPIIGKVIRDGIKEGLFQTEYPEETAEMLLVYIQTVLDDDMVPMTEEEKGRRMQAFICNAGKMLGVSEGCFEELAGRLMGAE
ncbi:MAG: TetR/AcrR family transcriptional regulator [Lachnospiraceae bacterium]|nr:TetR/AcrR family transcriptional regulator [Lachnospiraceae bacterium]